MKLTTTKIVLLAIPGLAVAVAVVLLLFSGPRMRTQPSLKAFQSKVNLPPGSSVPYTPAGPVDSPVEVKEATATSTEKGKTYYGYYCVFCHGEDGKGNGPVGESYMPRPADLTSDSIRNYSLSKLYDASFTGIGHSPVLENVIPGEHKSSILIYLKEGF